MLKHTISSTKTTKFIEKVPRGTLLDAFLVHLGVLGAPWRVDARNGSGALKFKRPFQMPWGALRRPSGEIWFPFVCLLAENIKIIFLYSQTSG